MLETLLVLAASVTGAVELVKSLLTQTTFFTALSEEAQSAVLQAFAFVFGVIAAFSGGVNLLATLPAYSGAPEWLGIVVTGFLVSTGSAGLHVLISLLGVRAQVTAEKQSAGPKAQAAGGSTTSTYAPFS